MLEIALIVIISQKIKAMMKEKGRNPAGYIVLFVFAWFGGEVFGAVVGGILAAVRNPGAADPGFDCGVYMFALLGAAIGGGIGYAIAASVPPLERHEIDYLYEDYGDRSRHDYERPRRVESLRHADSLPPSFDEPRQRHGCLTAWLVLMILGNTFAIATPLLVRQIQQAIPGYPAWVAWPLAVLGLLNVIFAVALLNWKKWGFYGFVASSLIALGLNLYGGIGIGQSLAGLIGIVILFALLKMGGDQNAWAQFDSTRRRDDEVHFDRVPDYDTRGLPTARPVDSQAIRSSDRELCYLCGKRLKPDEMDARVCQSCRA